MGTQWHRVRLSHQPNDWVVVDHAEYVDAVRSGRVVEDAGQPAQTSTASMKAQSKPSKEG